MLGLPGIPFRKYRFPGLSASLIQQIRGGGQDLGVLIFHILVQGFKDPHFENTFSLDFLAIAINSNYSIIFFFLVLMALMLSTNQLATFSQKLWSKAQVFIYKGICNHFHTKLIHLFCLHSYNYKYYELSNNFASTIGECKNTPGEKHCLHQLRFINRR